MGRALRRKLSDRLWEEDGLGFGLRMWFGGWIWDPSSRELYSTYYA